MEFSKFVFESNFCTVATSTQFDFVQWYNWHEKFIEYFDFTLFGEEEKVLLKISSHKNGSRANFTSHYLIWIIHCIIDNIYHIIIINSFLDRIMKAVMHKFA